MGLQNQDVVPEDVDDSGILLVLAINGQRITADADCRPLVAI